MSNRPSIPPRPRSEKDGGLHASQLRAEPSTPPRLEDLAESIARLFHEHYERLAPEFGYSTREESRTPWPPPNADLMVATTLAVLTSMGAEIRQTSIRPGTGGRRWIWLSIPGEYVVIRKDALEGSDA